MKPTSVIFRTWPTGPRSAVIALFPCEAASVGQAWLCSSYEHIGQHGAADPHRVVAGTRPATRAEWQPLARELRRLGYRLRITRRIPRNAYDVRRAQLNTP